MKPIRKIHLRLILSASVLCLASVLPAQAELHDRGGGLIYDDVLDVTWLQDATYIVSSGEATSSKMSWADAVDYAENLNYYDPVRNVIWSDWRLPQTLPVNGVSYQSEHSIDGSTDNGFNVSSPASELGYMYYVNLSGLAFTDQFGNWPQPGYETLIFTGPFLNLDRTPAFWSGTEFEEFPGHAWGFIFTTGTQHHGVKTLDRALSPWPVRDGDVAAGPVPQISVITPEEGAEVSGTASITVQITDMDVQAAIVLAGGQTVCFRPRASFRCQWDSTSVANGNNTIVVYAIATDTNKTFKRVDVTVNNP